MPGRAWTWASDLAVAAQRDRDRARARCLVLDPDREGLRLADDAERGRLLDHEAAVGLVLAAGEEGVEGGGDALGVGGRVVDLAVGQRQDGAQAAAVGLGQRIGEAGEERGAVAAAAVELDLAQLHARHVGQALTDVLLGLGQLLLPAGKALARRAVLDEEDGVGELLALLAAERGVGQRQEQEGEEGEAPADALGTAPQAPAEGECGEDGGREQDGPGKMRVEDEAE